MQRFSDYFAMGGHAQFIWPALGITAVVLIAITITSLWSARAQSRALAELEAVTGDREERRRRRRADPAQGAVNEAPHEA